MLCQLIANSISTKLLAVYIIDMLWAYRKWHNICKILMNCGIFHMIYIMQHLFCLQAELNTSTVRVLLRAWELLNCLVPLVVVSNLFRQDIPSTIYLQKSLYEHGRLCGWEFLKLCYQGTCENNLCLATSTIQL